MNGSCCSLCSLASVPLRLNEWARHRMGRTIIVLFQALFLLLLQGIRFHSTRQDRVNGFGVVPAGVQPEAKKERESERIKLLPHEKKNQDRGFPFQNGHVLLPPSSTTIPLWECAPIDPARSNEYSPMRLGPFWTNQVAS